MPCQCCWLLSHCTTNNPILKSSFSIQALHSSCLFPNSFMLLWALKVSASSRVFTVGLTNRCEFLWSDRHCDESDLLYWCSYNVDTLQGLMNILTRLSLWPHFLLPGGTAVPLSACWCVLGMCVCVWSFACERKREKTRQENRERERVCLCVLMLHLNWPPALSQE